MGDEARHPVAARRGAQMSIACQQIPAHQAVVGPVYTVAALDAVGVAAVSGQAFQARVVELVRRQRPGAGITKLP